jgi:radical SAM superfamily enzyme YgiQ (UPF0313 family)
MYKGSRYEERPLKDIFADIESAKEYGTSVRRVFLADGDAMHLPTGNLVAILDRLAAAFPLLARVGVYANSVSIASKSISDLQELKKRRLATAYVGLESGSDKVLELLKKKDRTRDALFAAEKARESGIKLSVIALIGGGGKSLSREHVAKTVRVLNVMQPPLLSLLTLIPVPGAPIMRLIEKGDFEPLGKKAVLIELKSMLESLDLRSTVFRCNHTSNPLPLEGRFPKDKSRLIDEIDAMLANPCFLSDDAIRVEPWML